MKTHQSRLYNLLILIVLIDRNEPNKNKPYHWNKWRDLFIISAVTVILIKNRRQIDYP